MSGMKRTFYSDGKNIIEGTPKNLKTNLNNFKPYYDKILRCWVSSSRQQEKLMKKHKSYSHPEGLYALQDDKKFLNECKKIRNNKIDYERQVYGENFVKDKISRGMYSAADLRINRRA